MCSPWQQPDHPDPLGINLRRLASVLEVFLKHDKEEGRGDTYAVFFDFASLMQKPASGAERQPNEAKLFDIALTNMMVRRSTATHSTVHTPPPGPSAHRTAAAACACRFGMRTRRR